MNARVEDYSLMDPAVQSDPKAFYALLHAHCPVYRMPETGMYVVTRYDDVRAVLRDPETFSNDTVGGAGINGDRYRVYAEALRTRGWSHVQTLQRTDPPVHGRYRRILDQVFNIQRVRHRHQRAGQRPVAAAAVSRATGQAAGASGAGEVLRR